MLFTCQPFARNSEFEVIVTFVMFPSSVWRKGVSIRQVTSEKIQDLLEIDTMGTHKDLYLQKKII